MTHKVEFISCQRILHLMTLLCFIVHEVARSHISITIIQIVTDYSWNEKEKNDVLGSYLWGYMLTAIPGGRLSEVYGAKIVIGTSMLVTCLLTLITPLACYLNYYCVIAVRVALGLALGVQWPAMPPMAARWFPKTDISKYLSHRTAMTLGATFGMPIYGYIMSYLGWRSVNYICGTIILTWTLFWFYLIYDSPQHHPRIREAEKSILQDEIKKFYTKPIPWKKIFCSGPVWAIFVANTGLFFILFTIGLQMSIYFDAMFHINFKQNGVLSSLPNLGRYIASTITCLIADKFQKEHKFSTTTIRKFFTTTGFGGTIVLLILLSLWGNNKTVAVLVFFFNGIFLGFHSAGFLSNSNDLAPTYCGTIFGVANMLSSPAGYFSTKMVTWLVEQPSDFEQWRYVFWIVMGTTLTTTIFYLILASGEIQEWSLENKTTETENLKQDEATPHQCLNSGP